MESVLPGGTCSLVCFELAESESVVGAGSFVRDGVGEPASSIVIRPVSHRQSGMDAGFTERNAKAISNEFVSRRTNLTTESAEFVIDANHQLWRIE